MELFDKKGLRLGYTTGSCAAAAALASALRITTGHCPKKVKITTPGGIDLLIDVYEQAYPSCGVIKDAGDDPDATAGMMVISSVEIGESDGPVTFKAGPGVGTITLPGLKLPPGEAAINPVPRQMIEQALREVIGTKSACVTVSIPGGEEKAKRTFNPRLGVVGGLSVLGTTGIVKPYNIDAVYESFTLELNTFVTAGHKIVGLTFGMTGEKAMRKAWSIDTRTIMHTGNYIGFVLDEALRLKFERVLLCGHPGKLLKVAAGTFDTYNRTGDGRREALCTHAALAGVSRDIIAKLYDTPTTEVAMKIVREENLDFLWTTLAQVTAKRCTDRMFGDLQVEAAYLDNTGQILGASSNAAEFAEALRNEK